MGTEILFVVGLGALLLGPKQLQRVLVHVARARAEWEKASSSFKTQLAAEIEAAHSGSRTDGLPESRITDEA